jgi:RND superfamily putative drug exporter
MGRTVPKAIALIVGTIFVLLFLMLGSLIVPLKAVVLNFLSLTVSFGALVWIFQDGHLAGPLGVERLDGIDALQPVLVFVIAFGLSMDYEVFLLSRIRESFDQTGDNTGSVALGIQRTGGIITSAAVLLGVVILGFAAGKVLSLKLVGVGLLLAILVDATLVRSLLVPATMRLLGNLNWWAPRPLRRVYERLGLGTLEPEAPLPNGSK